MIKLSTKGRYGVRAMLELAKRYGDGPILMSTIAEEQEISRKYLHALLTSLKSSGLVNSSRGVRGGYSLSREPSEIHLDEIVEALEGPTAIVHCANGNGRCSRASICAVKELWEDVSHTITQKLNTFTLADLIIREQEIAESS